MEYQLEVTDHRRYVHARATGPHTPENALRFLREAYVACVERGKDQLLLEQALTGPSIGAANIYTALKDRLTDALTLRRIAYVDAEGREDGRMFVENAARNRGVNIRTFVSVDEAANWLKSRA